MTDSTPDTTRRAETTALIFAALLPSVTTWLYFVGLSGSPAGLQQTSYTAGKILQFGLPTVWVFWLGRKKGDKSNYPPVLGRGQESGPRHAGGLVEGAGFGAVVAAIILTAYFAWIGPRGYLAAAAGPIAGKVAGFGIRSPAGFAAMGLFYSLAHSLLEEYYWRWFLFGRLRGLVRLGPAVALSSLAFAAHHVILLGVYFGGLSWKTLALSACVAVGGAVWASIYHRSRSLLGPWISHAMVDAAIFIVGYALVWR